MKVVFFHRKPRPNFNFSVENLFQQIRNALPTDVDATVKVVSYFSEGFFKRLFISFEAALNQGEINHVTGDINFITIFLKKRKTIMTILDVGFMNHPNFFARFLLRHFWINLPIRRAAIVSTISESTKKEVLKYVKVDPSKIRVVYVPILSGFVPAPKTFNKIKPVILQIGTKPNKNVLRLVKSLNGVPCFLEIIGEIDSSLKEELEKQKIEYRSSVNLSNQDILKKYNDADVVSFVSTYEGFGMPIVEANTVGRVVVTSNILSMPEVAGDAAHLVDPFNIESIRKGILKVINDDEYRAQLIKNGYENRKRFDVKLIAAQYADIYRELLGKK